MTRQVDDTSLSYALENIQATWPNKHEIGKFN